MKFNLSASDMDAFSREVFANKGKEIELFERTFQKSYDYSLSQQTRAKLFNCAVALYNVVEALQEKYDFYPEAPKYSKRFILKGSTSEAFDDGINYEAPAEKGLYFIGETHFNPLTDEKFYWVKIGKAINLKDRMKSYNTHNPMMWRIDFNNEYDREEYYHSRLLEIAIAKCNHNEEWFLVDKNTYLAMCEKGFSFFG